MMIKKCFFVTWFIGFSIKNLKRSRMVYDIHESKNMLCKCQSRLDFI